jgi:hypothetical protein
MADLGIGKLAAVDHWYLDRGPHFRWGREESAEFGDRAVVAECDQEASAEALQGRVSAESMVVGCRRDADRFSGMRPGDGVDEKGEVRWAFGKMVESVDIASQGTQSVCTWNADRHRATRTDPT